MFQNMNDIWEISQGPLFWIGIQALCKEKFTVAETEIPSVVVLVNQNVM